MPKIVISYRREDTAGITGRIHDRLRDHYGREAVFRDIDAIPLGIDFRKHLEQVLKDADAMVCVIGENWLGKPSRGVNRGGARRAAPSSRISDPADYVRLEVESALQKDIPVVPVLIDNTPMPKSADLPESMHGLMFRQALTVSQLQDFDVHTKRLIDGLDRTLATSSRIQERAPAAPVQAQAPVPQHSPGTHEVTEASALLALTKRNEDPKRNNKARMASWTGLGLVGGAVCVLLLIAIWSNWSSPYQPLPPQRQLPPQTQSSLPPLPSEGSVIEATRTPPQAQSSPQRSPPAGSLAAWTETLKGSKITEVAPNFFAAPLCSGCDPASFYCAQPVRSVSDLRGKKVRIVGTDLDMKEDLISAGATPMVLPLPETYQALTARVIDCVGTQAQ